MSYRINEAEIRKVVRDTGTKLVRREGNRIRTRLVRSTPRDSGRTASAWRVRDDVTGSLIVRADVVNNVRAGDSGRHVWELLHEGTGVHGPTGTLIVPVRRQVLRWRSRGGGRGSDGGFTFSAWSRGIKPRTFIVDALGGSSEFRIVRISPPGVRLPRT